MWRSVITIMIGRFADAARISLVRGLVRQPNLTLLDEPISTVYVTHDQAERRRRHPTREGKRVFKLDGEIDLADARRTELPR